MRERALLAAAISVAACSFSSGNDKQDAKPADARGSGSADATAIDAPVDSPPAVLCGNGVLDGSEECDDGNTKGSDGCSATCDIEPAWICPGGSGCELVTGITATAAEALADVGMSGGGGPFTNMCGPGKGIFGFQATLSDDSAHLASVAGICAQITFDTTTGAAIGSDQSLTSSQGTENHPPPTSTTCGSDELAVGFQGDADQFLAGIALICAPLSVTHGVLAVGSAHELTMFGPANATLDTPEPCNTGEIAQVYEGNSGATVDHFGMACATIAPTF